ncbi:MAG: hypothetical protein GTO71_08475 [Woeseiaceae bacterium]|nr:hypothetical protein [Woeseiaceae bacterium]NIP21120.1 hypothetical protein [Woeseiaceae bacterium]NIS90092.1 hypothetical protein [Woeseiaceae bacterium]
MRSTNCVLTALMLLPAAAVAELHVLIVEGIPGEAVYETQFDQQVEAVHTAARSVTDDNHIYLLRMVESTRNAVLERLSALQRELSPDDQLAIFLIGHGSYDDYEYKFNIEGPDLTGEDLAAALEDIAAGNQLIVNTSSASGATADLLVGDDRILVLATRSGTERHATRFGGYFAAALSDASADIDKNDLITVREAFDFAERRVGDYFERNDQLATEHPRLEGERSERLALARLGGARPAVVDTALAAMIAERDALSADIDALRLGREDMDANEYQSQLLQKMLELARIEDAIEAREAELGTDD